MGQGSRGCFRSFRLPSQEVSRRTDPSVFLDDSVFSARGRLGVIPGALPAQLGSGLPNLVT